jgi:threonine/homoserine/homoserine lactone efflux protein
MLTTANLWIFIIPLLIAAALPGPAQGALVAQVLSRGGRTTVKFMIGMALGNALWLAAALYGLSELAVRFKTVFDVVKWMGIAYLLFIAFKLWKSPPSISSELGQKERSGLVSGALLTVGNPKAVVFFGSILPHAFDMSKLGAADTLIILVVGVAIDLTVQCAYLVTASKARAFLRSARSIQIVNRSAAALMASAAALIAAGS